MHQHNSFITLTYSNEYLPATGSLDLRHFQLFMKKLRKKCHPKLIRYYHCGEYGEKYGRPHYHACLFNHDFSDKKFYKLTKNKDRLYTSAILDETWGMGQCQIGSVTFKSAAYIARYIMKKITGKMAESHYEWIDPETGEILQYTPEYTTMSLKPHGIGSTWLKKYTTDVYPDDFVIINGKKMRPPRSYDRDYEIAYPGDFRRLQLQRLSSLHKHSENNTPARLLVREKVQNARLKILPRNLGES